MPHKRIKKEIGISRKSSFRLGADTGFNFVDDIQIQIEEEKKSQT